MIFCYSKKGVDKTFDGEMIKRDNFCLLSDYHKKYSITKHYEEDLQGIQGLAYECCETCRDIGQLKR